MMLFSKAKPFSAVTPKNIPWPGQRVGDYYDLLIKDLAVVVELYAAGTCAKRLYASFFKVKADPTVKALQKMIAYYQLDEAQGNDLLVALSNIMSRGRNKVLLSAVEGCVAQHFPTYVKALGTASFQEQLHTLTTFLYEQQDRFDVYVALEDQADSLNADQMLSMLSMSSKSSKYLRYA